MRKFFDRGDVVFLDFDPSLGHEQKGRRPALILTKKIFNEQLRVACVAPITGGGSLARDRSEEHTRLRCYFARNRARNNWYCSLRSNPNS